jgi:transposase
MDLARRVYSRELKVAAMQELEAGHTTGEVARKFQLAPKLLERWRGEWRARGEQAFPGIGQRGAGLPVVEDARRIAELERKIGQLTMENDFLKKRYGTFRIILCQPSSLARPLIRAHPCSRRARPSRDETLSTRRCQPGQLLPIWRADGAGGWGD